MTMLNSLINISFPRYRKLINVYKPKTRFLSEYNNPKNRLSYINWLSESEKTNYYSKIDLKQCLDSHNSSTFSSFIDNYKNKVNELNYKISQIESYYRKNTDTINELEYEVIGNHGYYLKNYEDSLCLFRTDLSGFRNDRLFGDLTDFIIRNGQILIKFSDLLTQGIVNVKKLRISPDGKILSLLFDPELNDSCKVAFYSITNGKLLDIILEDVGEVYFMPYHKSNKFIRIYYTQLNNQKRSFKLYTSLIHNKSGKLCSKRLIYFEPNHFISLFKSKSGEALFMATTSYNKVYSAYMIDWKSKIYVIPTLYKTKIFMEYRKDSVYCIYSNTVSQIYKIPLYTLKPYKLSIRVQDINIMNNSNINTLSNNKDYHKMLNIDYIVTDIDMFNNGLVLYLLKPPSCPKVGIIRFGGYNMRDNKDKHKIGRKSKKDENNKKINNDVEDNNDNVLNLDNNYNNNNKVKYYNDNEYMKNNKDYIQMFDTLINVGIIEPGINYDYYAKSVKFNINSPGMDRVGVEVDLLNNEVNKINNIDRNIKSFIIEVASRDGLCKIPVSIVTKGEEIGDIRNRKCILYVYGFYGENLTVCNYLEHKPLLEMDYVLCFAHVRGGGELGEEWQKMGNKGNKHNSFYDLVDVIQHIIAKNITTRNRLAIYVSSASGILGGCMYNMRPDLCSVIIFKLPYLDLFTTYMDKTQPLVEMEYDEFGYYTSDEYDKKVLIDNIYSMDPCSNIKNNNIKNIMNLYNLENNTKKSKEYKENIIDITNKNTQNMKMLRKSKKPILIINCDESDIRAPWYHTAKFVDLIKENEENSKIYVKISNYGHDGSPPYEYVLRTCSEEISIIDYYLNKT